MKDFVTQIFSGKTLGRILFNDAVRRNSKSLHGKILDIAGGKKPSYEKFLPKIGLKIEKTDISSNIFVDMNEVFPYQDEVFDGVLFFNALYIAKKPKFTIQEICRVLKNGGELQFSIPFISSEIPEPNDYGRFTAEGIEELLKNSNFSSIQIERIGGKWASATNLLHDFWLFNAIRLVVYSVANVLDTITAQYQLKHPAPIMYYVIAKK